MRDVLAAVARLTPKGLSILVAVSGGPDSLCLLDALSRQSARRGWRLGVACLDHGLRPEARVEAVRVRVEAEARGLPFYTARADARGRARRSGRSLEATAREARYGWLARIARVEGYDAVATGHTADDQAETVLLRLLRGAGATGLAAMRADGLVPGAEVRLLRPLLDTTRAEVEAYCRTRRLAPSHDASNDDPTFTRNKIRRELIPALEAYNPSIRRTLARAAEVTAGEAEALQAYGELLWAQLAPRRTDAGWVFERTPWRALSRPAQRLLLRRAAQELLVDEGEIGFDALEAALHLAARGAAGRIAELGGGVAVEVALHSLTIWKERGSEAPLSLPRLALRRVTMSLAEVRANPDRWVAYIDLGVVAQRLGAERVRARDLVVRWPQPGDRFQPLGLGGRSQLLSDFFINARVPRAARSTTPLVVCGDTILWVGGQRPAHWARVVDGTPVVGALRFLIDDF